MSGGRTNRGHSVFQRLLNRARESGDDFNLLLVRYGVERFMYRLSISPFKACKHIAVICMVKERPIHYVFEGQKMDVAKIYSQIRKRRGRIKILANAQVEFRDSLKVSQGRLRVKQA